MTIHVVSRATGTCAERKQRRGRCTMLRCARPAAPGRAICNTCRDRAWREAHPEHHLWNNLKKSAKRRGIAFTITLEAFIRFCADNNLVARVGRGPDDLTVDRREAHRGYEEDNLRVLTNSENGRLGAYLSGSGHRVPGQQQLAWAEASPSRFYTEQEDPLAC